MKIIHEKKRETKQITFGDLRVNDVFGYVGNIYIRTGNVGEIDYNCFLIGPDVPNKCFMFKDEEVTLHKDAELKLGRGVDEL